MLRSVLAIFVFLLKAEVKTKQLLIAVLLFLLVDLFIFYFALGDGRLPMDTLASSVLWLIYTYVATMVVSNLYQKLRQNAFLDGLIMTGCGNTAFFLGFTLFTSLLLCALSAAMFLLFSLFFNWTFTEAQLRVFSVFFISSFGFSSTGVLVSELLSHVKMKELILPVVYFPMMIPLLMVSVKASLQNVPVFEPRVLLMLTGVNLILFFSSMLLYDFAKEELS